MLATIQFTMFYFTIDYLYEKQTLKSYVFVNNRYLSPVEVFLLDDSFHLYLYLYRS
jgi:hypothetical protein